MEPLPLAVGGVIAGWFARGLGSVGHHPVPAPIACSCSCECPSKEESSGWSTTWLLGLLVFVSIIALGLGALSYHWIRTFTAGQTPEVVITSPSKGKKGLGVVGKTLQLTQ